MNTGIEFPGDHMEPILKLPTRVDDDSLEDGILVVEFKLKKD